MCTDLSLASAHNTVTAVSSFQVGYDKSNDSQFSESRTTERFSH